MNTRPLLLSLFTLPLLAATAWAQAAPQPVKILPPVSTHVIAPGNTAPGGPPIPDALPTEEAHPPSILLWPNGAPGSEAHRDEAEIVGWRQEINIVFPILYNIHNPTITPFFPAKDKATGCAVVICPGGGNMFHTIDREGYDLGQWLADHGVAAFVLKYRLTRDTVNLITGAPQPYKNTDARADAQRAIRLVRSRAAEWGLDPTHVGIMGFSAGGGVTTDVAVADGKGDPKASDPIDRLDAHPNFAGVIYSTMPRQLDAPDGAAAANFPPAFLLCSASDPSPGISGPQGLAHFYGVLKAAKVPVELHIFEEGGHGFGVRQWSYNVAIWPTLFRGWLNDRGYLTKSSN